MSIPLSALPAIITDTAAALTSALAQLTAVAPANPYEATKLALFGPNYDFPKLSAVEVPEGVTVEGMLSKIIEIENNFQTKFIDTIVNPDKYNIIETNKMLTPLAELSGENTYVTTEEKFKGYIEYVEMVSQLDIDSITQENCYEIAKKMNYAYINMMSKKTI